MGVLTLMTSQDTVKCVHICMCPYKVGNILLLLEKLNRHL